MRNLCTVYRKDTGQIVQYSEFTCQEDDEFIRKNFEVRVAMWGEETHAYVEAESNRDLQYVAVIDGIPNVVDKPELIVFVENDKTTIQADGMDETTLTGLPDPCEIIIDDPDPTVETQRIEVTGGGFIFAAENPGLYTIEVIRFPFLSWKVEITAL